MAAKRSPILGYNHNVRYRGLVFHVQTEDSGVLSPHLFTHLFYEGVIVSTRKLVYDSGAAEDAIKALMQAQHKAVLKDLKKGSFDDKIDQYLGGTPGLLPRDAPDAGGTDIPDRLTPVPGTLPTLAAASQPAIPTQVPEAPTIPTATPTQTPVSGVPLVSTQTPASGVPVPRSLTPSSQPVARPTPSIPAPMARPTPGGMPTMRPSGSQPISNQPRTVTLDRTSGGGKRGSTPPQLPIVSDAPTLDLTSPGAPTMHDLIPPAAPTQFDVRPPHDMMPPPPMEDPPTVLDHTAAVNAAMGAAKAALAAPTSAGPPEPEDFADIRSSPEIEIAVTLEVDDDDSDARPRFHRDTDVSTPVPIIDTPSRPVVVGDRYSQRLRGADSVQPLPPPPEKRSSVGASALPPSKPPTRPPAVAVVARPMTNTEIRGNRESDSVEVYAPPPTDTPPPERPGQYSLRRSKPVAAAVPPERDRTGPNAIPAGLARPPRHGPAGRTGPNATIQEPVPPPPQRRQSEPMPALKRPDPPARTPTTGQRAIAQPNTRDDTGPQKTRTAPPTPPKEDTGPLRQRTPTPARISPMPARTQSSNMPSPVVMTRPAVIVGAPPKTPVPRVRKAREEEGRGFGQGLISEKSLDEVILAYLSEDAEEK